MSTENFRERSNNTDMVQHQSVCVCVCVCVSVCLCVELLKVTHALDDESARPEATNTQTDEINR